MLPNNSPPFGERMARLETQMDRVLNTTMQTHNELREHVSLQRSILEKQNQRMNALEQSVTQTRTHLKWMKAIWMAVQGTVLCWLGIK